jgi:hypothetical protein
LCTGDQVRAGPALILVTIAENLMLPEHRGNSSRSMGVRSRSVTLL